MKSFFYQLFIIILIPICHHLNGQDRQFNQQFEFKDGIYLSFNQLIKNEPAIPMTPIIGSYINGNSINKGILKVLQPVKSETKTYEMKLEYMWAICIDGIPMKVLGMKLEIQNTRNSIVDTEYMYYLSRFSLIGNLTYYQVPKDMKYWKTIKNFVIKFDEPETTYKLKKKTLVALIEDDKKLVEKLKNDSKKKKNLLVYVSEYNRRNPVYIKD